MRSLISPPLAARMGTPVVKESMPLTTGMRLGRFEVLGPLGSGGMGEVYRARDRELDRDVAIKVLPEDVASDPVRLARFDREARAAAALAHPNILVVHEVGTTDRVPFVVFELLHGQTLRTLLGRRLGLTRALDYGTQIAEGLAAAHDRGIVHRDVKPDNLFVSVSGQVKILDFGIASWGGVETGRLDVTLTLPGAALGTAGYMAPEQVRGETVDARADVFALGAVLYEMLTGRRAFSGATSIDCATAILSTEPATLTDVAPDVPDSVAQVVDRCLRKAREQRFQSARDVAFALEIASRSMRPPDRRRFATRRAVAAAAVTAALIGGTATWLWLPGTPQAGEPRRFAITLPASDPLSDDIYVPFAISPDGSRLAYVTSQPERVLLRHLNEFDATPITGTDGAYDPFFSPDGQWIGFWTYGRIKKVALSGGPALEICEAVDMLGASWGEDGTIVFAPSTGQGLFAVPDEGGVPRTLTTLDPSKNEIHHAFPQVLDGGRTVLFTAMARSKDAPYSAEVFDVASSTRRTLVKGAQYARYVATGHIVYLREQTIYALRVATGTLDPEGPPVAVVPHVQSGLHGQALFSVGADGTLVYLEATPPPDRTLVWVTPAGAASETGLPARPFENPRVSPRGDLLAVEIPDGQSRDIWTAAIGWGTLDRLTLGRRANFTFPTTAFSPDGARIAYAEDAERGATIVTQPVDGIGAKQEVLSWRMSVAPSRWMPDGSALLLSTRGDTTGGDLLVSRREAGLSPATITDEPGNQWGASPSADGRYLVYVSDETGRFEVFVRPYPGPGPKRQLTTEGGTEPIWNPRGRAISYRSGNLMMTIPVTTTPSLVVGRPVMLFEGSFVTGSAGGPAYDVAPDGRFLMMRAVGGHEPLQLRVVLNWFDELKGGRPPER